LPEIIHSVRLIPKLFLCQNPNFLFNSPSVSSHSAVAPNHSVAWHILWICIFAKHASNRPICIRTSCSLCHFLVCKRLPRWNLSHHSVDTLFKCLSFTHCRGILSAKRKR